MNFFRKKPEETLKGALLQYIKNQTRNTIFKNALLVLGVASATMYSILDTSKLKSDREIAVVQLKGEIKESNPLGSGMNISRALNDAMNNSKTKTIVIHANSGGGSPVQGEMINETIKYLKTNRKSDIEIIVSIGDMCASACYLAIQNADRIYAHKNSLVGSIGVRMDGIEVDKALSNFGIERRTLASGKYKALLDPYKSLDEEQKSFIQEHFITPLYQEFVNDVKSARGDKLASDDDLFTGLVWTGKQSLELGLIDEIKTEFEIENELLQKIDGLVVTLHHYNQQPFSLKNLLTAAISDSISASLNPNPVKF